MALVFVTPIQSYACRIQFRDHTSRSGREYLCSCQSGFPYLRSGTSGFSQVIGFRALNAGGALRLRLGGNVMVLWR